MKQKYKLLISAFMVLMLVYTVSAKVELLNGIATHPPSGTIVGQTVGSQTITVVDSFPSPATDYSAGLEWDGKNLWVSDAFTGMIYYFDPVKKIVKKSFHGPTNYLRDLAWDGSHLWVTSWDNPRAIYKLDPSNGAVISSFAPPFNGNPDGLTWDGNFLWIGEEGNNGGGIIYKVSPRTGRAIYSIAIDPGNSQANPRGLAWDGSHIWAGYQSVGLIKEHNIRDGSIIQSIISPSSWGQQGLAYYNQGKKKYLWSTGGADNMIYKIKIG
jgi:glutamine cyclotransferase